MIDPSDIQSRHLKIFLAVMDEGSLGKAAKKIYLTQPAISQALALLEDQLGVLLFHRSRKGVIPTKAAEYLREGVLQSESCLSAALSAISELDQMKRGNISIAASDTLSLYLLAGPLGKFRAAYPHIDMNVRNRSSDDIVDMVRNREADIGLISVGRVDETIRLSHIDDSPMMLIMPPGSESPKNGNPTLKEIASLDLILLEKGSRTRRSIEQVLHSTGVHLNIVMEVSSFEVAKRFVREGLGSSLVPQIALQKREYKELNVYPTPKKIAPVSYGLITLHGAVDPVIVKFNEIFSGTTKKTPRKT